MKKYVQLFFFITLIAFKVAAVQVYWHDCPDDGAIDDCEICENAIHNQNIESSFSEPFYSFEICHTPAFSKQESHYESVIIYRLSTTAHFGRPPPSLA